MIKVLGNTHGSLKWLVIACLLAVALGVGFIGFNQLTTTKDKYTAQANAEVLAQDIKTVCDKEGTFVLNNRDICEKGENVLSNPNEAIPGPKGDQGEKGDKGDKGEAGADSVVPGPKGDKGDAGADSVVPGPKGDTGDTGLNGNPGTNGTNGTNGADSTVPGPQGEQGVPGPQGEQGEQGEPGEQGEQGETGPAPTSYTLTDPQGTKYTCVQDPVGSTTYSCTAEKPVTPIPIK